MERRDAALVVPRQAVRQARTAKPWSTSSAAASLATVEVELGPAAAGRVVVEEGLAAGDLVVLPARRRGGRPAASGGRGGSRRRAAAMSFAEALALAFDSLRAHRLRSFLTMLGVVFGVGAVIAMLSIGAGAEQQSLAADRPARPAQRDRSGPHTCPTRPCARCAANRPASPFRDAEALADAVPGVVVAAPQVKIEPRRLLAGGEVSDQRLRGAGSRPGLRRAW